jgi:hypothetical protein
MKKPILLSLLICIFLNIVATANDDERQRTIETFKRLKESAQPQPVMLKSPYPKYLLSGKSKLPLFLNVNATMDELTADPNKMQNESSISVNPTNPKNIIASAVDYRGESSTWVYVSHDGGITWRNYNLGKPYPNWRSSNDPSVMFDAEGVGYLVYGGFGIIENTDVGLVGENGVFIARTTNQGNTWEAHIPVIVHTGPQTLDSNFEDKYYVQVDNSPKSPYYRNVYIPWKRVTPRDSATQIVIAKSEDLGYSWTEPLPISHRVPGSSEDTTFGQSFPLATTGPNGELYVVWNHGIVHGIGFVKSYDGGKTFTEPRIIHNYNIFGETKFIPGQGYRHVVKGKVRAEAYPVVVCDITEGERSGTIYLCWSADNPPNIYFSKSTDEGETWSSPIIVHEQNNNDQFWPWLSLDPKSGEIAIMYLDSRNDPENIMIECYVSFSSDGGDTWIDRRVSDIVSDIRLNPFSSNAFAGDYSGNAFFDGIIYPSWVDMRNAVSNIADSDVYTAIVNTRAPEAPTDFAYKFDVANPSKVDLSWVPPTKKAFGQPLLPEEYELVIYRDNKLLQVLPGGSTALEDTGLIPFEPYDYKIYAVRGEDKSISRELTAYPGGSRKPSMPEIMSIRRKDSRTLEFDVKIPSLRTDNITPIHNVHKLNVYLDSVKFGTFDLTASDTGKIMTFSVEPSFTGFGIMNVDVEDYFPQIEFTTRSDFSVRKLFFSGTDVDTYSENFDMLPLPKYHIAGNWVVSNVFSYSPPNALTESPNGDYKAEQKDTIIMFPIDLRNKEMFYLTFRHAALIRHDDTAHVEIAPNLYAEWTSIGKYNRNYYEPWQNTIRNFDDWKFESIIFENKQNWESAFVRFRFDANRIFNDDGWYLDNIQAANSSVSVKDVHTNGLVRLYPNPASDFIILANAAGDIVGKINIYNIFGQELFSRQINTQQERIDLTIFPAGFYFVEIKSGSQIQRIKFTIVK